MYACDISCEWTLVTAPTEEPITVEDAKLHVGITDADSDALIQQNIITAREAAEQVMNRGLTTQTWKAIFGAFANIMPLPMAAPLASVTHVKYYDSAGTQQTLATSVYDVDTISRPGRVVLKPSQSWPSVQSERRIGPVEIQYVVGWTSGDLVPERIKQGIRILVKGLDEERNSPGAAALARVAAQACWDDRIYWTPPRWY